MSLGRQFVAKAYFITCGGHLSGITGCSPFPFNGGIYKNIVQIVYYMVFQDADGTLLDSKRQLSPNTRRLLKYLKYIGVK